MKVNGERDLTDSPCIGICSTTNVGDEVCIGCHRTAQEVIMWNSYTDQQRIEINLRLQNQNEKN
ncbi:MAG: DUF1289 domain-containing protein [Gammaproteobacteria bacterium]|nr:DUF1289 domain-containing protein [Gammaproteobacteria bacterium]